MMNGHGKSDRPVVPAKSPNNVGQPTTEGVEGRGLAKGNLPLQNASRTPSRTDAPNVLERVRQAAGKDKKLRFTALLHHIYDLETLRMAYFSMKKEAAPGVDGETWRHSLAGCLCLLSVIPIPCAAWASLPKVRAGCGNPACPDLWRGLYANMIPTPTIA